jgi:FMN-dependent NADH-azoreductase
MPANNKQVLEISSSGRIEGSTSRALSRDLISALEDRYGDIDVAHRDLATGIPVVDEAWITANFTPEESRTRQHRKVLAYSDGLVAELQKADILVIGVSMYNFSITATLKAWIDMIARARLTFRYTENGPEGLLSGKKAYLVVATGGVPVGSPMDFATPYLRHALAFVGITDVEIVAADRLNSEAEESLARARAQIANLVHLETQAA